MFTDGAFVRIEPFDRLLERTGLSTRRFANRGDGAAVEELRTLLPEAVRQVKAYMTAERATFEDDINARLQEQMNALERLRNKQYRQLELFYQEKRQVSRKEEERREIDRKFDEFIHWVEDTMTTEDNPFIQVIAVLRGEAQ